MMHRLMFRSSLFVRRSRVHASREYHAIRFWGWGRIGGVLPVSGPI